MKLTNKNKLSRIFTLCAIMAFATSSGFAGDNSSNNKTTKSAPGKTVEEASPDPESNTVEPPEWICKIIDCGDGAPPKIISLLIGG